jgi:pimeloyl-ACP methyl ester carboxylesterase
MSQPRIKSIACASPSGLHRMAYYEWGNPGNEDVVLCVHGLTRTGRDFDLLAQALSERYRVICPDVVGRGLSDWLAQPAGYAIPQYAADMVALIGQVQPKTLRWVGTSMGGLIAMTYAALVAHASNPMRAVPPARLTIGLQEPILPIKQLVLNDVGPRVESASLARIGQYLAQPVVFESFEQAVQYMKQTIASFGPHTDEQWEILTRHYFVWDRDRWTKHYDPGIALAFSGMTQSLADQGEMVMWQSYQCVQAPTLILHGEQSDLLLPSTVQAMLAANPKATAHSLKGIGHAPSLIVQDQIDLVCSFLDAD